MRVHCEGCAGCCIDWRSIAPDSFDDHERHGSRQPLDDAYNLVPLTREDARAFLDAGFADALTPRLWRVEEGSSVEVDGVRLAAVDGKPVFFLGIRKPPKPVAPFGRDRADWLPTCVFLDPATLQCRIHGEAVYPTECADYPGHNLELDARTECERVEDSFGGDRLLDTEPPEGASQLLLGPQALGERVFVHPDPERLAGVVARVKDGDLTPADRAEFVAAAAAGQPGTTGTNPETFERTFDLAREASSWAGAAVDEWERRATTEAPDPALAADVEGDRGAPGTSGWN